MTQNQAPDVLLSRELNAPVEQVYRALTDGDLLVKWWQKLSLAETDVRVGGSFRFEWTGWDGYVTGEYLDVEPNKRIRCTWDETTPDPVGAKETEVTFLFARVSETRSRLTIEHRLNSTVKQYGSHRFGWADALDDAQAEFGAALSPVSVDRVIKASPERVFEALTQQDQLNQWFFTDCKTDPRPDGEYAIDWKGVETSERDHQRVGKYTAFEPGKKLAFTWGKLNIEGKEVSTQVTITLQPADDAQATRLQLVHDLWPDSDAGNSARNDHDAGWQYYMYSLGQWLIGGEDTRVEAFGQRVQDAA